MSWASIRTALAARIFAVSPTSKVHAYQRFTLGKPGSAEFSSVFLDSNGRMNAWMVTRVGRKSETIEGDDRSYIKHKALILGFYGLWDKASTDTTFDDLVDAVAENLRNGDRTLGGACQSFGEIDASMSIGDLQGLAESFHFVQMRFEVMELS